MRLWDRAVDPIAATGCDRGELLARAADAASRAGAITRALTLVGEALDTGTVRGDPTRAGVLQERRGWYLMRAGRDAEALESYERAVALVPERPPSPARVGVVQAQGHALERAGRHGEARARAEEAIALALPIDDAKGEGQARHVLGLVLAAEARTDEAIGQLHQAGQIAVGLGDLAEVAGAYVHLWRTLVEAGRGGDLVDLIGFLSPGSGEPSPSLMGSIGAAALHQLGRWDEAERLLGTGGAGAAAAPYGGGESAVTAGDPDAGVGGAGRRPWRPRPGPRAPRDGTGLVPPGGRRPAQRAAASGARRAGHLAGALRRCPRRGGHRPGAAGTHRRS